MRRIGRVVGIGLAGVAGLAVAGALMADRLLETALRHAGFAGATASVDAVRLSGARLSLTLVPGLDTVEAVDLSWSAAGLLAGRIDSVAVRGARLRLVTAGNDGPRLAGLPLAAQPGDDATAPPPPALPIGRLTVADSLLTVEMPSGALVVPLDLDLSRTAGGFIGRVALPAIAVDLATVGAASGGAPVVGRLTVNGLLDIAYDRGAFSATVDGCVTVAAEGLAVAGRTVAVPGGLCVQPVDEAPLLGFVLGQPGSFGVAARLTAERIDVPDAGGTAGDVAVAIVYADGRAEAEMSAAAVRVTGLPALALTARGNWAPGEESSATAEARDASGALTAEATGRHDPVSGAGEAEVRVAPVDLGAGGPALAELLRAAPAGLDMTGGRVAGRAQASWGVAGLDTAGSVLLDGVSAALGPVTVAGVNGVVRLSSLYPPVVPDGQALAVKLLDVGLPLTDGTVVFGYGRDGMVDVDRAEWRWAGGVLRARAFELSPARPDGTVVLEADGVGLGALLDLAAVEGLSATGTLSGRLPVRIDGTTVRIEGGSLSAGEPGRLRYDPAEPPAFLRGDPGSPTDLLRGALTDFRYRELRMTVDGTAGGELAVRLSLEGANPDFYDGHPVRLNLNLSGALDRILRQSLDAYRIPDAVRDRMTEFGRKTR